MNVSEEALEAQIGLKREAHQEATRFKRIEAGRSDELAQRAAGTGRQRFQAFTRPIDLGPDLRQLSRMITLHRIHQQTIDLLIGQIQAA
ncbi:MAG TPA: hypothetical protein VII92_14660, partial [Anaerolineae bacterium]